MPRVTRRRSIDAPVERVWELVSDPYSLPRWWPRTTRVENVQAGGTGGTIEWTKVLETAEGRAVRADYRCTASEAPERYGWEQRIEGSPFERHLQAMTVDIELAPRESRTVVQIAAKQSLKGLSLLGSPAMRRAQAATLEEALNGIVRAVAG